MFISRGGMVDCFLKKRKSHLKTIGKRDLKQIILIMVGMYVHVVGEKSERMT